MFLKTFSFIGILLLFVGTRHTVESAACAKCLHLTYELRNMPTLYRMILDSILSDLDLENLACESNSIEPESCPAPSFFSRNVAKCSAVSVSLSAVGITGILPDAEMTVTVVTRSCVFEASGKPDGCTNLAELDERTQEEITASLRSLEGTWDRVSYSGQVCTSTP